MSEELINRCLICGMFLDENQKFCVRHNEEKIVSDYKEAVVRVRDVTKRSKRDEIKTCPHCKGVSISINAYCVFCGYDQKLAETNQIIDFYRAEFDFLPD